MFAKSRFLCLVSLLAIGVALLGGQGCDLTSASATAADSFPTVTGSALYVSASAGSSSGDGTAARPFAHIADALKLANSGTTIAIAAGSYAEALTVPAGVSLTGTGAAHVLISGGSDTAIRIAGSGATALQDLAVVSATGAGIRASGGVALQLIRVQISGVVANATDPGHGLALDGAASADLQDCTIRDNSGVGVYAHASGHVSIIDPLFVPGDALALTLQATDIAANGHFGIAAFGGDVTISGSAIHGIIAPDGDGILIGSGKATPVVPAAIHITSSLVSGNARAGVLVTGPAALQFAAESSANGHGGLWAQHPSASITTDASALIARNTLIGIAASNGARLEITGSRIADTQAFVYTPAGATTTVSAADGIGVYTNAHGVVTGATLSGNSRAAVLAKDCASAADGSPDLAVTNCTISGSKWGIVVNGHYALAAPATGAGGSNDFQGVDPKNTSDTSELDAPESACADASFSCNTSP